MAPGTTRSESRVPERRRRSQGNLWAMVDGADRVRRGTRAADATKEKPLRILVVDDEPIVHQTLGGYLRQRGLTVEHALTRAEAIGLVRNSDFDIALIDIRLADTDGFALMDELRQTQPEMAAVLISAHGDMDAVIQALRQGAVDFLRKPVRLLELDAAIEKARQVRALRLDGRQLRATIAGLRYADARGASGDLIGNSAATLQVVRQIEHAVRSACDSILITGETGTGKEVVARALHRAMSSSEAPFVAVSCPTIPDTLVESEFFGHVRGSFTGATGDRAGYFALADGGTLFLDEVGDLSSLAQASLLRVLETRQFRPVGAQRETRVSIRVIAATNAPLEAQCRTGRFRPDLFYRLNVFRIQLTPLRARRDDILPLADHFLEAIGSKGTERKRLSDRARRVLEGYSYPGNVRELRSIIERAAIMAEGSLIEPVDIVYPETPMDAADVETTGRKASGVVDPSGSERQRLVDALEHARWNRRVAAESLSMPYSTFRYKLLRFGIR